MNMAEEVHHAPNLKRSKYFATMALIIVVVLWIGLLIANRFLPEYTDLIHILMLGAEAGVVGGLADWYAITVLFRNPFGKLPIPKFLRDHTEIIPRNKARIAESMGRFVQENFLSPQVVERSLEKTDLSLAIGQWLASPQNNTQVVQLIQQTVPKVLNLLAKNKLPISCKTTVCNGCVTLKSINLRVKCCVQYWKMISTRMYCNVVSISRMSGWYKIRIKLAN